MEIAHVIDDLARVELGVNLNRKTGLDFDNDIVHGENPKYGVPSETSRTGYFTNYDYTKVIAEFSAYIQQAYQKREYLYITKLKEKIGILLQMIRLLERILELRKSTPVTMDELEGHHNHVH